MSPRPQRMHAGETLPDLETVRALLARCYPDVAALPLAFVAASGTENVMARVGTDYVLRLPRHEGAARALSREIRTLCRLPPLGVDVPEVAATAGPTSEFPYPTALFRWREGTALSESPPVDRRRLARDLGALLKHLHATPPDGLPDGDPPLAAHDAEVRIYLAGMTGHPLRGRLAGAWDRARSLPPAPSSVWTHGDVAPGNVLVSGGRLTGLIDWAGSGIADPAVDLCIAWSFFDASERPLFRTAAGADAAAWERARYRALAQAIKQWPYYRARNSRLAAEASRVFSEVLAEL